MANTLSNAGIVDGQTIFAAQVNQIVDSLTGDDAYDITISGSLELTGSLAWNGSTDASGTPIQFVVIDPSSGELYTTGSSGGGSSTDTGSLMVTGSVTNNVLTFTKGDGSTFDLTVATGSGGGGSIDTGSFYISSSVSNATITFNQGDGSTEQVTVNNVVSSSYALTSSHTPEALITASLAGSSLTFTKGDNSQFSLALPGGGGGNPITGSYTGSVLTTNIQSIDFTGAGVIATVGGSNDITVNIPGGGSTDTGSLLTTGSVSNATLTFTKGDGSTFPLTVNNVANAITAGSVSSDSIYSEAAVFDVWTTAGNTFTLLDLGGTNIQVTAPKNAEGANKLLAVTTMEAYRGASNNDYTTFEYRLYNSTQAVAIPGSTRNFSSNLLGSGEGAIPTTFTFTLPISSDVSSGDTIELQVRQTQGAASVYLSASISYADLSLVSITT
jgi:hypothetical protein